MCNLLHVVEERSQLVSTTVTMCGWLRSEYVGISNEKIGGIPIHRKPKDSERKVHPLRVSRYLSRGQLE